MEVAAIFTVVTSIMLAVCWKFARRTLSEHEFAAWRVRSLHPIRSWLRFVGTIYLLLAAAMIVLFFVIEVSQGKREFGWETLVEVVRTLPWDRALRMLDGMFAIFIFSVTIGSLAFSFWYWNGIALYQKRLIEELTAKLESVDQSN